jgi:hypothetical protein
MDGKLISGPKIGYDLARVGAGEARGANRKKQLNAAAWSGTWPAPGSTLDLDFVNDRGWVRGVGQGGVMDAITFTRASNATYVGEDGLLKSYSNQGALGKNLLTFPQDFISWNGGSTFITPKSETAPDGSFTASLFVASGGSGVFLPLQGVSAFLGIGTVSFYAKRFNNPSIRLATTFQGNGVVVEFNLDTETATYIQQGTTTTGGTPYIENVGNGWYRCIINGISFNSFTNFVITSSITVPVSAFIWGAQLEEGTQATEYFPTNIGVPRFDWGSTTQLPQRNLLTRSGFEGSVNGVLGSGGSLPTDWFQFSPVGEVVGSGIEDGKGYFDLKVTGTGNTTFSLLLVRNTPSNTRLISVFTKISEQSGVSTALLILGDSFGGNPVQPDNVLTTDIKRLYRYKTIDTIGQIRWQLIVTADSSFSLTVRFSGVQLELDGIEPTDYQETSALLPATTPLAANPTLNGILVEEARTNRVLWCRDATQTIPYTPPDNFFAQSETFTNASWNFDGNQTQLVRTENQSDPFDGTSATKIVPNAGRTAANAYIGQRSGASYPSTHSIYAKAAEYNYLVLSLFTYIAGNFAVFNLSDGTITTSPTIAGLTAAIENVGDGWYRCSITTRDVNLNRGFLVSVSPNGTTTATAAGGSGIFIYGAHSNNGDTPTTYVQTTVLDPALWILSDITAAKDQTGIDGVANAASSLTATANNGTCFQYITLVSGTRTCSAYLKRITGTGVVQVSLDGVTWSTVDLSDTEWRRVVLSGVVANPALGIKLATSGDSVAMDFAQVEDGGLATTPVFTTSTAATRNAEVCSIFNPLFSLFYNNSSGSFFCEFDIISEDGSTDNQAMISVGTINNNVFYSFIRFDERYNVGFLNPGVVGFPDNRSSKYKGFVTYGSKNRGAINGILGNLTNLFPGSIIPDRFGIGYQIRNPSSFYWMNGRIKRIIYFPFSISDEVLSEISNL